MVKPFDPISYNNIALRAFAFKQQEVLSDQLLTIGESSDDLLNCFKVEQFPLIRTSGINHSNKAAQFNALLSFLQSEINVSCPTRLSVVQPNLPALEWEEIELQHNLLFEINPDIISLNFPMQMFSEKGTESEHPSIEKEFNHLSQIQNAEGWYKYCVYLNDEMERVFRAFQPLMIDEYQLEAKFENFRHEVKSSLLQTTLKSLKGEIKEVLSARETLFNAIEVQQKALEEVEIAIGIIETVHPNLLDLKRNVIALKTLLKQKPIDQQILLHQLLNNWLGVLTSVSGDDGLGRISLEFAMRQAISQVDRQFPSGDLLHLVLNWQQYIDELNSFYRKKGKDEFLFWISVPPKDEENKKLRQRLLPLYTFQTCFLENLEVFGKPIDQINGKREGMREFVEFQNDPRLTSLFPPNFENK